MLCRATRNCWVETDQGLLNTRWVREDEHVIALTERDPLEHSAWTNINVVLHDGTIGNVKSTCLERCRN